MWVTTPVTIGRGALNKTKVSLFFSYLQTVCKKYKVYSAKSIFSADETTITVDPTPGWIFDGAAFSFEECGYPVLVLTNISRLHFKKPQYQPFYIYYKCRPNCLPPHSGVNLKAEIPENVLVNSLTFSAIAGFTSEVKMVFLTSLEFVIPHYRIV